MHKLTRIITLHVLFAFLSGGFSTVIAQTALPIIKLPATISKPGRYLVKKDLVLKSSADAAITIAADDVQLDLGGHVISTVLAPGADVKGIASEGHGGISVFNGTVRGFTTGVRINSFQAAVSGISIESLRVEASASIGLELLGLVASIQHCRITNTGGPQAGSAAGVYLNLGFATVTDNDILATLAGSGSQCEGVHCGSQAAVFENNRVLNDPSAHGSIGMFLAYSSNYLVENNRLAGFTTGIHFTNTGGPKYRNNFTTDCVTPYFGGTDAGNNK